jgi:hypothetical protein
MSHSYCNRLSLVLPLMSPPHACPSPVAPCA